jgi:hypothetical protein
VLTNYDVESSDRISVESELRRLQAVKRYSYRLLDQDWDPSYQRLAALTARVLHAPMAAISLVDLGRHWHVARYGFDESSCPREVPRTLSICAHTVVHKKGLLVVPQVLTDGRFRDNSYLQKSGVQFYAGAALIDPQEGCKLGTLYVTDTRPRPEGLTGEEEQTLLDLAAAVMELMDEHRKNNNHATNKEEREDPFQSWGAQRSARFLRYYLTELQDDSQLCAVMNNVHRKLLRSAYDSANYLYTSLVPKEQKKADEMNRAEKASASDSIVTISNFAKSVEYAMDAFPKNVPIEYHVDLNLPKEILMSELKIFRSCIALLTSACERTNNGFVRLCIFAKQRNVAQKEIVFECQDSGPDVELEQYADLFDAPDDQMMDFGDEDCIRMDKKTGEILTKGSNCATVPSKSRSGHAVHAIADYIGSIEGGDYGFRPRETDDYEVDGTGTGSVFWFSIPWNLPLETVEELTDLAQRRPLPWIMSSSHKHGSFIR